MIINQVPKGTKGAISVYGGCEEFLHCKDHQIFLYGSAGSGKTTSGTLKLIGLCMKYPGVKALFTRDSYTSLVKTGADTLERVLRELGWKIGKRAGPNTVYKLGESKPTEYRFPYSKYTGIKNGKEHVYEGESRILLASLSSVQDEMGAEYDYIYVNQPEFITEDDWLFLVSRANGRRDHAPYPQLWGDPNPAHPQHWIWKGGNGKAIDRITGEDLKLGLGDKWTLIRSTYHDNPSIWDQRLNCFTKLGEEQIGRMEQTYNPVMKRRLIDAEWCSYEGMVYADIWDPSEHLIDTKQLNAYNIDESWDRYWAFDFGFDEPFVWSCWAKSPIEDLYIRTKLIYMSGRTIIDHADAIRWATIGEPRPKLAVADRDPESIVMLSQALGINIISTKKYSGSIKARTNLIYELLKKNKLKFYKEALIEADPRLLESKLPIGFEQEVHNLRWKPDSIKEERIGGNDHEDAAIGYLFSHLKASTRTVPFIWK